jgi:phospholipase/carboxylesterase
VLAAATLLALVQLAAPPPPPPAPTTAAATQSRTIPLPDEAVAYVPASAGPNPQLLVLLHGAGRGNRWMIDRFKAEADRRGIILLAPTSKGPTWDMVSVALAPVTHDNPLDMKMGRRFSASRDARRVEAAIANLAKIVPVDRARTVLAGFSDGATFALAMGMARAYPFAAVIAWSPGVAIEASQPARGRRVFVSHGREDPTLSFAFTCGEIVPLLRSEGADVTFMAFEGVHEVPKAAREAFLDAAFGPLPGQSPQPLPAEAPLCPCNAGMDSLFVVGEPTGYGRSHVFTEGIQKRCGGGH